MFDLGNLVAIGITLIIVLAYRILDRDNRSLDKVKKYADKLRDDLGSWADQRAEDLKNYSIELEVQQKAAREILRRVQTAEESLAGRAEQIGGIADRLAEYDKALAELRTMSTRVDQNLAAIHGESAFIDGVARTLKDSKADIDKLRESTTAAREKLQADIQRTDTELRQSFESGVRSALQTAHDEVDELNRLAREGMTEVEETNRQAVLAAEERFRAIETELTDAFRRARDEGEILEEAATRKLREQIEARGQKLTESMDATFNQLRDIAREKAAETQGIIKSVKSEWKQDLDAMLAEATARAQAVLDETGKRIDSVKVTLAEADQTSAALVAGYEARSAQAARDALGRFQTQLQTWSEQNVEKLGQLRSETDAKTADIAGTLRTFMSGVDESTAAQRSRLDSMEESVRQSVQASAQALQHIEEALAEAGQRTTETIAAMDQSMSQARTRMDSSLREAGDRTDASIAQLRTHTDEALVQARTLAAEAVAGIERQLSEAGTRIETSVASIDQTLATTRAHADGTVATIDQALAGAVTRSESTIATIDALLATAARKVEETIATLSARFADRSTDLETRIMAAFEKRAVELRDVIEDGMSRLEGIRYDADRMEGALRKSMESVQTRLQADFAAFGSSLAGKQQAFEGQLTASADSFRTAFMANAESFRASLAELEENLNALKSRAYSDVSDKLRIFEDDFFADLRQRSQNLDTQLAVWKEELEQRLADAMQQGVYTQTAMEKAWADEARAHLAQTQGRIQEAVDKLATQVDAHRAAISDRLGEADSALANLRASVQSSLDDARTAADAFINAELERWKHTATERVQWAERQHDADARAAQAQSTAARAKLDEIRDAMLADAENWKATMQATLMQADTERKGAIAALADSFRIEVSTITDSWEAERQKVLEGARAERETLSRDIRVLSDEVGRFRQEMAQKTAQALDDFNRTYSELSQDVGRKVREAGQTMAASMEEYRRDARTARESFDAARAQMLVQLDDDRKLREKTFADLDRRVKEFQSQTRLFDRADEMKTALTEAMEAMKADLARVDSRRAEMAELETQYGRIKRLEDEMGQKITKFTAEKRRIDTIEEDFRRLMTLSQDVDKKLASITSTNDQLTELQATIRNLVEASADAEKKYERVEKKSGILDATADAVDKNFQAIENLDRNIRSMDAEIHDLPDKVAVIKRSVDDIMAYRPKLDDTSNRLEQMDQALSEAERRITEVQKAREWLARAETRFTELNTKTEEHLRLLNDLLKDEPTGARKDKGAPSLSVQETVRKLSHQGWKVEEIARAVKLSRGEVELILELGGRD